MKDRIEFYCIAVDLAPEILPINSCYSTFQNTVFIL